MTFVKTHKDLPAFTKALSKTQCQAREEYQTQNSILKAKATSWVTSTK